MNEKKDMRSGSPPILDAPEALIKKQKRPYAALIVLLTAAALAALLFFLPKRAAEHENQEKITETLSLAQSDAIQSIIITHGEDLYTLQKRDGLFVIAEQPEFPVIQSSARRIWQQCAAIPLAVRLPSERPDYGLNAPSATVQVTADDGKSQLLLIGNQAESSGYYVRMGGNAYVVSASVCEALAPTLNSLHTVRLPNLKEPLSPVFLRVSGAESGDIEILQQNEAAAANASGYSMVCPFNHSSDAQALAALLENLAQLRATAYVGKRQQAAFAQTIQVIAGDKTGAQIDFSFQIQADGIPLLCDNATQDVYALSEGAVSFLVKLRASDLIDRFFCLVSLSNVGKILICTAQESITLSIQRDGQGTGYACNGRKIAESDFKAVYRQLCELLIDRVLPEPINAQNDFSVRILFEDERGNTLQDIRCVERNAYEYTVYYHPYSANVLIAKEKVDSWVQACKRLGDGFIQ